MVREPPALIAAEVERLRTAGVEHFGVNVIPAATPPDLLERQIETILALRVPVVGLFWDIDAALVARLRDAGVAVVYQVGAVAEAVAAERAGAQLVIAQGREAGGHVRGTTPLRVLLPAVAAAVKVPVLAAGGLATGGDLVAALGLGAQGIVLGTALIAARESFAHDYHKQRLRAARPADTRLTDRFHVNWPKGAKVRVLHNSVTAGRGDGAGPPLVIGDEDGRPIYLTSTDSPLRITTGDLEAMALYAGTGVGSVTEVRDAAAIVGGIVAAAEALLAAEPAQEEPQAESASSACYAGEMGGAYMGELDPAEVEAEVAALIAELRGDVARRSAAEDIEAPPFTADDIRRAGWVVMLEAALGHAVRAQPSASPQAAEELPARLGALLTRLPRGRARSVVSRMRAEMAPGRWSGLQAIT
jgi:nitronate monooxygenase